MQLVIAAGIKLLVAKLVTIDLPICNRMYKNKNTYFSFLELVFIECDMSVHDVGKKFPLEFLNSSLATPFPLFRLAATTNRIHRMHSPRHVQVWSLDIYGQMV